MMTVAARRYRAVMKSVMRLKSLSSTFERHCQIGVERQRVRYGGVVEQELGFQFFFLQSLKILLYKKTLDSKSSAKKTPCDSFCRSFTRCIQFAYLILSTKTDSEARIDLPV